MSEFSNVALNIHRYMLSKKPHIKKYLKLRELHGEIMGKMMNFYYENPEKLKKETQTPRQTLMKLTTLQLDMEKREDCQLVCDLVVYPHGFNSDTCTYFLEHKKVRTQEKIEFVESMRNSKLGIYEIKEKLSSEGLVKLRNVLSNETVTIVDQGMSMSNTNNESQYLLLRIIETSDLCFQSGLIFVFQKKTLTKWLKKHKGNEILFNDVLDLYYLKENDRFLVKES